MAEVDKLKELLVKYIDEDLVKITISNPVKKEFGWKIHIRPIKMKGKIKYQASEYKKDKVYHHNLDGQEAVETILSWLKDFKQMELSSMKGQAHILFSKKGKITIKEKNRQLHEKERDLSHNRKKKYILEPDCRAGFLIDLGVLTREGNIVGAHYDKFRQINRFLEFIEDILPQLPVGREVSILDFGCGKSYLTFAMYYYLNIMKGYPVRITGLDLKKEVIEKCNGLAEKYGFQKLNFYIGDIAEYEDMESVDMVVSLHACDTATDHALDKAIRWGAKVILAVPCCQHELNGQMENEILAPVLQYGLIKERIAALVTDALRANILACRGYQVQILEFIDMEHTPKNILIRAVKAPGAGAKAEENHGEIMDFLHVNPTLAKLQQRERAESYE